jgi:hypothetical protein
MRSLSPILVAALAIGGCHHNTNGNDMSGVHDMNASTPPDVKPVMPSGDGGCATGGEYCASDATCCSGHCDTTAHICTLGACAPVGGMCNVATDCCNLNCVNGSCGGGACISDGQACTAGGQGCCSTQCDNGTCKPLNTCKTAGNSCMGNSDCCSGTCVGGKCPSPSTISYCTQNGDICFHDNECCTGVCTIKTGATAGTCAAINAPCTVDGLVCNGCTGCCSSFCAPFGTSSTKICQPAGGCHVLGDLCLKNSDCCGGDFGNMLPGSGEVICVPDTAHPQIGTCSMANVTYCPMQTSYCHNSCQPEGDVCHFKNNGGCSSNSFPNDCCGAPGNSGVCKLDVHGVPRCYGLAKCVAAGGDCASSADCCGNLPCIPGPGGHLICATMQCVPQGGVCTATSDCCSGFACVVPPGSTTGTCINPNPPPMVPPDMAGSNGGVYDLSTPPPMCALLAQKCSPATSPCCANNGNCVSQSTGQACTTQTDCICAQPIL